MSYEHGTCSSIFYELFFIHAAQRMETKVAGANGRRFGPSFEKTGQEVWEAWDQHLKAAMESESMSNVPQ